MASSIRKLRVFLSYAKEDIESVYEIHDRLKNEGWIEPWQDKTELLPGEHWTAAIKRAIDLADVVIIFLSDNSINKEGFVHYEMNYAWERSLQKPPGTIYRIPIRLDDCDIPEDIYELDSRQWADYFDKRKDETYGKLLIALKQRLEQKERLEAKERVRVEKLAKKKVDEKEERDRKDTEEKKRLDTEKVKQERISHEKQEKVEQVSLAHKKGLKEKTKNKEPYYDVSEKNKNNISSSSLKQNNQNGGSILTAATAILFGCPGMWMCFFGSITVTGNGTVNDQTLSPDVGIALICIALIFILIPVGVGFFTLRKKPEAANDVTPPSAP